MSEKYKNKYRSESIRLQHWDYRWPGSYFITICTADREYYLGSVSNGRMHLSHVGVIADILWYEIPNHNKNITLGEFIVMPNHIHGILILKYNQNVNENDGGREHAGTLHATSLHPAQSTHSQKIPQTIKPNKNEYFSSISPKPNSISTIIRSYKSAVTRHAHRLNFEFEWQSRFYDIIIRDEKAFRNISFYIRNNPRNGKMIDFRAGRTTLLQNRK